MKKILLAIMVLAVTAVAFAFTVPEQTPGVTKTFRYQPNNASHVFDGVSPYWVEVSPGAECDADNPELPCTVQITIGNGAGEYANLDAFLDQYSTVGDLMDDPNVTDKDIE